jgi:hypothetical protein
MQELLWSYVTVKSPYISSSSSIHSYPMTTAGFKIRSILPTQKSNNPGGLRHETWSTDIPPPPCTVWDQNVHIIVQVTSHQLQLQSPECAPMAVFVGFLVDTVAMEQVLLWVLQCSPVKSWDTVVIFSFLLYHRWGGGWTMHPLLGAVPKDNVTLVWGIYSRISHIFLYKP